MARGEHLGTAAVKGAFALVIQFHKEEEFFHQQVFGKESPGTPSREGDAGLGKLIANIGLTSGGFAKSVELYGEYVARQIGLRKESQLAKTLVDLAMGYLSGDKSSSDQSLDNIVAFLSRRLKHGNPQSDKQVFHELVKELDACMISYFSFHWKHSAHLLDQVRTGQRNLRSIVMAATRKHRFQRAMQTLKTKRAFTTLLETLKAMKSKRVDKQADEEQMLKQQLDIGGSKPERRRPVFLMVGGGMGAGKSTVVKEILHGGSECTVRSDAVVVEADAFKETDVLYRSLSSGSGDVSLASQLVHDSSTLAASSLLVSALNEGRDVVFDGTMSWEPFVVQTIAMARDVHRRRYRLGPGYKPEQPDVVERYWEPVQENEVMIEREFLKSLDEEGGSVCSSTSSEERVVEKFLASTAGESSASTHPEERPAYRIVLVGVACDALLAVVRGIRRAIITNRFVPIQAQLRSHKMFAGLLESYCELVDSARIYTTSKMGGSPELSAVKVEGSGELRWLNEAAFEGVRDLALLNPDASSVLELYQGKRSKVWEEIALAPDRAERQMFLYKMLGGDEESEDESLSGLSSPSEDSSSVCYSSSSGSLGASSTDCLSRLEELTSSNTTQEFVRDD